MWGRTLGRAALFAALAWPLGAAWSQATRAGAGEARPVQVIKLGHQFARDSLPDRVAQRLAQQVAAQTQQQVRVEVYPAAAFGDELEHLALLRRGALDLAVTGDLVISSLAPSYRVVNMPFLYRDVSHALATYASPLGQEMRQAMADKGLQSLSWHHVGTRLLTANRPVRQLDELKGLSLRLPPDAAWMAVWAALGAHPQQLPFTELPAALKLGKVQAQENPPNFIRANKLYEHQKYLIATRHMPQRQFVLASQTRWTQWPPALRQTVQQAAREASRWAVETAEAEDRADLAWLQKEGGMVLVPFDTTGVAARLERVATELGGPEGNALYRRILEIR